MWKKDDEMKMKRNVKKWENQKEMQKKNEKTESSVQKHKSKKQDVNENETCTVLSDDDHLIQVF